MPRTIELNDRNLKNIIGDSQTVVVFGFMRCRYYSLINALAMRNIETEFWYYTTFPLIEYDRVAYEPNNQEEAQITKYVSEAREWKAILTSLIIQNYQRSLQGKPLFPLLFCVAIDDDKKYFTLDLKNVASSHRSRALTANPAGYFFNNSATNKELRRCYKIYAETTPEIKKIVEQTIKFVKLCQDKQNPERYTLELLPAFWDDLTWENLWQLRKSQPPLTIEFPKEKYWKNILTAKISELHQSFFNQKNKAANTNLNARTHKLQM